MSFLHLVVSLFLFALASALPVRRSTTPQVSGTPQVVGTASSSIWNRDSCLSTHVNGRQLWTCRDSQSSNAFLSSTASWTDFNDDGSPAVLNEALSMYGDESLTSAFFAVQENECGANDAGSCGDGTRYAIWPDTRPMPVTKGSDGTTSLYTWIAKSRISADFTHLNPNPAATLYRADYASDASGDQLPPVTVVDENFWSEGSILYGNYGFVIKDGTAYLYGLLNGGLGVALAKVSADAVEDKSQYSYYSNGGWSSTPPDINDLNAGIQNAGTGGQGTFYYSDYFGSYVWIGAPFYGNNADFQITTAPSPEGPWTTPTTFYSGQPGTAELGAYSQQAHPGMSENYGNGKDIYLSYTKVDGNADYSTPLIHVQWQ